MTRLGSYELDRLLAQGGMADVYLARHAELGRPVALKVLSNARAADPEARALFLDEARHLAMLDHANLATVYEVDAVDDVHYLAMEFVHGADLRELLGAALRADRAIPYDIAAAIVSAAAAGLDHAHGRRDANGEPLRLVHRDVSLSNIMISHDGAVKVIDFGIATAATSTVHTQPGVVRGKASYMSPEQCLGDAVDRRADVFALGIVLYELTTGHRCFPGNSDFERMLAVVRGEYAAPSSLVADYPDELEQVVRRALALDPARRYQSAADMIAALELVAVGHGWSADRAAIARLMRELFGASQPRPSATIDVAGDATDVVELVPDADDTVVITKRPRRFARGTAPTGEPRVVACDDDSARTRGRRSVPRLWQRAASAPIPPCDCDEPMAA